MREFQILVEQLQAVGGWLRCLPVVLNLGGSSLCRVNQFSVVHEYGGRDAEKCWRTMNEERKKRKRRKMKKKTENTTKHQIFHFVSIWLSGI